MVLEALPIDMVLWLAHFLSVEDLAAMIQLSHTWRQELQQEHLKRSIQQTLWLFTTQQLLNQPSHTDIWYLRRLACGAYRCRMNDSTYDHFFMTLDCYPSFMQVHEDTESGMFELGVVHTSQESWLGMISFDRFLN